MNQDKFDEMWAIQLGFNNKFFNKKLDKNTSELSMEEKISWTKNQLLSIVKEAMEVLDEIPNWKEHRNTDDEFVPTNLYEEIIDVNKFALGLAQIWDMDSEQFYNEFKRKSLVVDQRWSQEQELCTIDKNQKVVGIDIDGVLGMYHEWFTEYCKQVWAIAADTFDEVKTVVGPEIFTKIKAAYRQSGWKATMPAKPGASELTKKLKAAGYQIIILTARPYKKYTRIYPDTLEFLETNDIMFDAIIWDEKKHLKIIKKFPNMDFMIEDTPSIALEVAKAGYPVYIPTGPANKDFDENAHPNLYRISGLEDLLKYFK
jgi:uncharacterized HAD superfamily protein